MLGFEPMSDREKRAVLSKSAGAARTGRYEKYKTSTLFDGTTQHPRWLESAQP